MEMTVGVSAAEKQKFKKKTPSKSPKHQYLNSEVQWHWRNGKNEKKKRNDDSNGEKADC